MGKIIDIASQGSASWQSFDPDVGLGAETLAVGSVTVTGVYDAAPVSATKQAAIYRLNTAINSDPYLVIEDTVTGDTGQILITSAGYQYGRIAVLSETLVAVFYDEYNGGSTQCFVKTFSISGVTPTLVDTSTAIATSSNAAVRTAPLSSTRILVGYQNSGGSIDVVGFDVDGGGNLTKDSTTLTVTANQVSNHFDLRKISSSTALVTYLGSDNKSYVVVVSDGDPCTLGTAAKLCDVTGTSGLFGSNAKLAVNDSGTLALTTVARLGSSPTEVVAVAVEISGTTLTVNSYLAGISSAGSLVRNIPGSFAQNIPITYAGFDESTGLEMFFLYYGSNDPLSGTEFFGFVGAKDADSIRLGSTVSVDDVVGSVAASYMDGDKVALWYEKASDEDFYYRILNRTL